MTSSQMLVMPCTNWHPCQLMKTFESCFMNKKNMALNCSVVLLQYMKFCILKIVYILANSSGKIVPYCTDRRYFHHFKDDNFTRLN